MHWFLALAILALLPPAATMAAEPRPESYWRDYLRAMREPVPLPATRDKDGFQFRWTRLSGSHDPVSIRVWRSRGRTFVRSVRLKYRLDFKRGRIVRDQTSALSAQQTSELVRHLRSDGFWRLLDEKEMEFKSGFLGGARWLFEMRDGAGGRFLSMFSPALLAGQPKPPGIRDFQPYVSTASFLLRTTDIFPDESEASY